MRPLVSPVTEFRLMAIADLAVGLILGSVAVDVEGVSQAVIGLVVMAPIFGAWMYRLVYRGYAARTTEEPLAPPTAARESLARTGSRAAVAGSAQLVLLGGLAVFFDAAPWPGNAPTWSLMEGISVGMGMALLLTSRWWRRWEQEHHRSLPREPRWRWRSAGGSGWGRGRGIIDPQDFYVVDAAQSP